MTVFSFFACCGYQSAAFWWLAGKVLSVEAKSERKLNDAAGATQAAAQLIIQKRKQFCRNGFFLAFLCRRLSLDKDLSLL
ncbi:MAG: hypothetical protein AAF431_13465 [Pseudomonadota bacterium]